MTVALIYPHQLFEDHPALYGASEVYVLEDPLFFGVDEQWPLKFHIQKLILHKASLRRYTEWLQERLSIPVRHLALSHAKRTEDLLDQLPDETSTVQIVEVVDDVLSSRIEQHAKQKGWHLDWKTSPMFLSPPEWLEGYGKNAKKPSMAHFYQQQRLRMNVLLEENASPVGGKWSFDEENRKKLPRGIQLPMDPLETYRSVSESEKSEIITALDQSGVTYWGSAKEFSYPVDHEGAKEWLEVFLRERFAGFGTYEDALSAEGTALFHSVLSPVLNIGLLDSAYVVDQILIYARENEIALNDLEGLIRQIIGWREFVRLMYERHGRVSRSRNFFGFQAEMPSSIYEGNTGIYPVDHVIAKLKKHAYSHHIERLMVMGNFFVLLKIKPDAVYRWFMEMYIDAYDWVMVPNVYGMSQFSDGGIFITKPYVSGSNYLRKMSNYPKGGWCLAWDSLFWSFVDEQREFFGQQYRMKMMLSHLHKMRPETLTAHHQRANDVRTCLSNGRRWQEEGIL